jgi:hypothetical protein
MWWLAGIWFAGGGLCFLVLVVQSQLGTYEPQTGDVWGWFLPTVMPTLALIVGALVADYRKAPAADAATQRSPLGPIFLLGAILSAFYLLLVALSIVMPALQVDTAPITLMQRSNFYLGPLQGLCVAALGFFFQSKS